MFRSEVAKLGHLFMAWRFNSLHASFSFFFLIWPSRRWFQRTLRHNPFLARYHFVLSNRAHKTVISGLLASVKFARKQKRSNLLKSIECERNGVWLTHAFIATHKLDGFAENSYESDYWALIGSLSNIKLHAGAYKSIELDHSAQLPCLVWG